MIFDLADKDDDEEDFPAIAPPAATTDEVMRYIHCLE